MILFILMDRYTRILVIIFLLCLINLGLNLYLLSRNNNSAVQTVPTISQPITRNSPQAVPTALVTTPPNIQSDLNTIKAEIRALRDSLELTGIIPETPKP
jgi:hypothetical protein